MKLRPLFCDGLVLFGNGVYRQRFPEFMNDLWSFVTACDGVRENGIWSIGETMNDFRGTVISKIHENIKGEQHE